MAGIMRAGEKTRLKLEGFPERTFQGEVAVVSPQGILQNAEPVFFARVSVENPDGLLRAGMQGRGKINTGLRSAGVVLFRRIGMWMWTKLWNWFGW
jgi:multidrug efflux pump subunit AcrA (membrane-fusion protein)